MRHSAGGRASRTRAGAVFSGYATAGIGNETISLAVAGAVVLDAGRIVADGPTREVLSDPDLLRAHRLELPFGFEPSTRP